MGMDPRSYVSLKPIPYASHVGKQITARSAKPVYTCEVPTRKHVSKENYERRQHQKKNCGYRSVNYKPYEPIGEVILDEKELILKSLGQSNRDSNGKKISNEASTSNKDIDALCAGVSDTADEKKVNSTRTEDYMKDGELQSVNSQINKGKALLNKVRLGIDLFKLLQEEQKAKVALLQKQEQKEQEEKASMKILTLDTSTDDESEADLSRYMVTLPDRSFDSSSASESEDDLPKKAHPSSARSLGSHLIVHSRSDSSCSVKSFINISRWQRTGSIVALRERTRKASARASPTHSAKTRGSQPSRTSSRMGKQNDEKIDSLSGKELQTIDLSLDQNSGSRRPSLTPSFRSAASRKPENVIPKEFRKTPPRPFSPIHTNINFYKTQSREHTFRQLCIVCWILEAMSQDQQPAVMPPISNYWNLRELKEDAKITRRKVERDKVIDPTWKSFLTNPTRFSQGRTARRQAVYQRRVSVTPTTLLRLSANKPTPVTTYATPTVKSGLQISSVETACDSDAENQLEDNLDEQEKILPPVSADNDSDVKSKTPAQVSSVSFQVPAHGDKRADIRKKTPGFRDKAFIVRDVIMTKSESKPKTDSNNNANMHLPSMKMLEDSEADSEIDETYHILKKRGLSKDSMNWKAKFTAAAIATFGAISINAKAEKLPKEQRQKFLEVKEEQALVVHDSIEVLERNRMQSMEKKLCSLHVLTSVFHAINEMRVKGRLNRETDEERKARYSVECIWYKNLLENLPQYIKDDPECAIALDKIAQFGSLEGRKITPMQFLKVISQLRSWELCDPDISAAVEYVRDKIVQMDRCSFDEWAKEKAVTPPRSLSSLL